MAEAKAEKAAIAVRAAVGTPEQNVVENQLRQAAPERPPNGTTAAPWTDQRIAGTNWRCHATSLALRLSNFESDDQRRIGSGDTVGGR